MFVDIIIFFYIIVEITIAQHCTLGVGLFRKSLNFRANAHGFFALQSTMSKHVMSVYQYRGKMHNSAI